MTGRALPILRVVGIFEAISYLLLVFVAMPLKYGLDLPQMVSWTGMIHGILFVMYLAAILFALVVRKITLWQSFLGVLASLLPFGPFVYDRKLHRDHNQASTKQAEAH
ncbi:DUF3817 domain-containing protein [Paenibacillus massiliensis]|uniref:DUF3817 domain-containing protein n=1 Tax=Paenibacillus massiliensis TaxID=225917 RepID=UPI0003F57077|nr:DUF3817 domain-containing protein [Paenibacillus massiliensis]